MREFRSRSILCLCILSTLFLLFMSPISSTAQLELDDLAGVRVAIYNGNGVMGSSRIALTRMYEWMNATVANITASEILADQLSQYDIFVIPGGSEGTASTELDSDGKQKIKDFVAGGGSYFGICGGSTFGVTYLRLFNGFISPVDEPGLIIHSTLMHVNLSSTGPDLSNLTENFTTMYYNSQYFSPRYGFESSIQTIATYESNGRAGMIAFPYGNGTVFLSSPHPEYEEDDDRDDTTFGDDLTDPDSEWELMFRVSKWLVETSYVESPNDFTLIAVVSSGGIIAVLAVAVLYRRVHR
ncbi:MAG: hypothetical protein JW779_03390 [Candidatus Thorarchaeota archaeon]|nr:hypothetical protein [Candidatus Thorarchaeota archaeon]